MKAILLILCLAGTSCAFITREAIEQVSHFTLSSLHANSVSLSYTYHIPPIEQIPP